MVPRIEKLSSLKKAQPRSFAQRREHTPSTQSHTPHQQTPSRPQSSRQHTPFKRRPMPLPVRGGSDAKLLRVIPLGGVGEFGRNMMVIEYGNDAIIIDMGLMFPLENMPGVDYVLPDISYARKIKDKIRGVFITHGHLDHTGAIPYFIRELGSPPVYGTRLTNGMIKERLEEFRLERHVRLIEIHPDDIIQLGVFKLTFFRVNHNIPDSIGIAVHTPYGVVINTGDWKFDHTPQDQRPTEFGKIAQLGDKGVLLLCGDSTNAEKAGYCISEKEIQQNLEHLFSKSQGRIIIGTFSSLVSRIQQIINAAEKLQRKVAVSGMSMEKVVALASELGYIKIPKGTLIKIDQTREYPEQRLIIIATGSQGQETSSLGRMSRGEHRHIKIQKGDTVILSSSPIPGNERAVTNLMNNLFSLGAHVVYNKTFDVHTSGHANREELKLMFGLVRPRHFVPIHGEKYMQMHHADIARQIGIPDSNIFVMDNGHILEFNSKGDARLSAEKLLIDYVMVDGLGVGDTSNVVIRDRQVLAQDGMVVVIATVDGAGKLVSSPDIISRGFIYVKGADALLHDVRILVKKIIENHNIADIENWNSMRGKLRDDIGKFLFQRTEKRPMILPVIIKV